MLIFLFAVLAAYTPIWFTLITVCAFGDPHNLRNTDTSCLVRNPIPVPREIVFGDCILINLGRFYSETERILLGTRKM